jgi:phage baseplate assembly protein gpV
MKAGIRFKLLFSTVCFFILYDANAQICSTCSVTISGSDTSAYTVNTGETLCLDSLAEFTGSITLNGGVICNKGIFNPFVMTATTGTIHNQCIVTVRDSAYSFNSGVVLVNTESGYIFVDGDCTLNGASILNSGILRSRKSIIFNSGQITNTAILNCKALSGASISTIINSGIINID